MGKMKNAKEFNVENAEGGRKYRAIRREWRIILRLKKKIECETAWTGVNRLRKDSRV
jgi:hypothetical protein